MDFLVLFGAQSISESNSMECSCFLGEVRDCDHSCTINSCAGDEANGRGLLKATKQQGGVIKKHLLP